MEKLTIRGDEVGIKMSSAYYSLENRVITINEARNNSIKASLYCKTDSCRVPISYIGPSQRTYISGKVTNVRDFFKLSGKNNHVDQCEYNTEGQLKIFARDSDGILKSIGQQKYDFRLNLVTEALASINGNSSNLKQSPISTNKASTKVYVNKGKLDPYLSTMKKIMQLRSKMEDNTDLSSLINLKFAGKKVPWKNFYYSHDDHLRCFNYLKRTKERHPICIEGEIASLQEPSVSYGFYVVQLSRAYVKDKDKEGIKQIASVSFNVHNQVIWDFIQSEFKKGKLNIAFYSFLSAYAKPYNDKSEYLNIKGQVNHKKQIHVF